MSRRVLSLNGLEAFAWYRLVPLSLLLLGGVACVKDNAPDSGAAATASRAPEAALDLTGDPAWPSEYAADSLWVRAAAGDDIDQARLGRRESAETLLAAVDRGGGLARTALAALPYASDRSSAREALCALLGRANEASLAPLLDALYDLVMNAPDFEDGLEPNGERRCAAILQDAARRGLPSPAEQDRARVVLTWLARTP